MVLSVNELGELYDIEKFKFERVDVPGHGSVCKGERSGKLTDFSTGGDHVHPYTWTGIRPTASDGSLFQGYGEISVNLRKANGYLKFTFGSKYCGETDEFKLKEGT